MTTRETEVQQFMRELSEHAKDEQKKLAESTKSYMKSVESTTKSAIRKTTKMRTIALSITLGLVLGISLTGAVALYMKDMALVAKHPTRSDLILCKEIGEFEEQSVCLPK